MKKISILIFVCIVSILLFSTAFAQSDGEPVVIVPYRDPPDFVYSNQEVILGAFWGACNRGLFGFFSSVQLDWTLNGNPIFPSYKDANKYWGSTFPIASGEEFNCIGGDKVYVWGSDWRYSIGVLDPGEYTIGLRYSLKRPTVDGADNDGDNRPDRYEGELINVKHTFFVIEP